MRAQKIDFLPRLEGLDAPRGFALIGLFLARMSELYLWMIHGLHGVLRANAAPEFWTSPMPQVEVNPYTFVSIVKKKF